MMRKIMTRAATETSDRETARSGTMERFLSDCSIRAVEGEGNERKFKLSFSSEEPYDRFWGTEILSHADGAVDLTRVNSIGVVLFTHDRNRVIGKILNAKVENNRGEAEIEFDNDADSEIVYQKVAGGTLKGVSVGYTVEVWEDVAANKQSSDGKFTGPCSIATRWTPYEISIVSIPADPTVGVGRSKEQPGEASATETGVGGFYYDEKQLQINHNYL